LSIALDLVELDGKATPEAIVEEVLRQNPDIPIPVPIDDIARLAGVEQIRPLGSSGFEGMLVTNETKTRAEIFFNPESIPQRQRFTIGHELGHLLLPFHRQLSFECSKEDMTRYEKTTDRRIEQEAEANRFASELLMPRPYFKRRMKTLGEPDLGHAQTLASECKTSLEATARRYVGLSDYPCAVVFAKERTVRYYTKSNEFPYFLDVKSGLSLPTGSVCYGPGSGLGEYEEVDSYLWLEANGKRLPEKILEQTIWQDRGYKIVFLYVEATESEDEEE
jgi:hypothetical protein